MGRYVLNGCPPYGKVKIILAHGGGHALAVPDHIRPESGIAYICVMAAGTHLRPHIELGVQAEVALVIETEQDLQNVCDPEDLRPRLLMCIARDQLPELEAI